MSVITILWCVAALLGIAVPAMVLVRRRDGYRAVYGASLVVCILACLDALSHLLLGASTAAILPLGLPWLGMHLRIDPLAAFFLVVVNFGGAAASLYGLGYGRHEPAPSRVLPFFPAFLAAMNLVVIADDAF